MFDNKTVFIIGAGASWHYGYPTGEELVQQVILKAGMAEIRFKEMQERAGLSADATPAFVTRNSVPPLIPGHTQAHIQSQTDTQWIAAIDECNSLASRLTAVSPLVIDYFLGHNPHLANIGRLCIAWALLEREAVHAQRGGNENRRILRKRPGTLISNEAEPDKWYRFLIHKLVIGCPDGESLLKNQVTFVTFNYDVSLETELRRALSSLQQFEDVADEFLDDDRVMHIYGAIREKPFESLPDVNWRMFGPISVEDAAVIRPPPVSRYWADAKALFDAAYEASKGLQIIAPAKADTAVIKPTIEKARQAIADAECVYILGYGFDKFNNELLNLQRSLDITRLGKKVLFTNMNNKGVVNKNASRLFFHRPQDLLAEGMQVIGGPPQNHLCEKSVRNVYDALADDFDSPEERV